MLDGQTKSRQWFKTDCLMMPVPLRGNTLIDAADPGVFGRDDLAQRLSVDDAMIQKVINVIVKAKIDVGRQFVTASMVLAGEAVHLDVIAVGLIEFFADLGESCRIWAPVSRQAIETAVVCEFHSPNDSVIKGFSVGVGFREPVNEFLNAIKRRVCHYFNFISFLILLIIAQSLAEGGIPGEFLS